MDILKHFFILLVILTLSLLSNISYTQAQQVNNQLCTSDDVFQTPDTGSFVLDAGEELQARDAMNWIYSMMEPLGERSNGGDINFDEFYNFDYEGVISGSYSLETPSDFPEINPSPLVITSPSIIPDGYRGIVTGTVNNITTAGTHEVRPYLYTDTEYPQLVTPGSVDASGNWSLDLSSVSLSFSGSWRFRLYEVSTNTQVGESWPRQGVLENLEIRLYSVTDAEYLSFKQEVLPGGVYSFPRSFSGTKRVKLINNNGTVSELDDIILDSSTTGTGLVRSYELFQGDIGYGTSFQERTYSYDQALAVSSALSFRENTRAKDLVNGLILLQHEGGTTDGAFYFSAPQLSPSSTDPIFRTGAHSIALYSLLHYIEENPTDPDIGIYINSANKALNYLDTMFVSAGPQEGLYLGGSGRYVSDEYEDYTVPWASTEHNLDTWHTFKKAAKVLNDDTYRLKAEVLESAMLEKLWNPTLNRFYQGYGLTGPDIADALDTSSWGSMVLIGINEIQKAQSSINRIGIYEYTDVETGITGWGPYSKLGGYPGAVPNVWYEGSFGVLMAYARNNLGELYQSTLDDLKQGQLASGAFRYATEIDSRYEIINSPSVASTAWYILSTIGRDNFWQECSFVTSNISIPDQNIHPSSDTKGSSIRYVCSDPKAINYDEFGKSNNNLCEYTNEITLPDTTVINIEPVILIPEITNNSEDENILDRQRSQDSLIQLSDQESINQILKEEYAMTQTSSNQKVPISKESDFMIGDSDVEQPFFHTNESVVFEEFPSIWIMVWNAIRKFFTNIINI